MIIKNKKKLLTSGLREAALQIIESGINRVLPPEIMDQAVKFDPAKKILIIENNKYNISKGRIFVVGGGKASGLMAETLEKILGSANIACGIVNSVSKDYQTSKTKIIAASHPTPDMNGVKGVARMLSLKKRYSINKYDLVICLISGGGSALMPCPVEEIGLADKQEITKQLVNSGATIHEINAVRKHLSKIKGGRLGRFFSPAKVVSLIISDVIGNNLDVIASGPTAPDESTFPDAYRVLETYDLLSAAPGNVIDYLKKGCLGEVEETPKELVNCHNHIIGDNRLALDAMAAKSRELGFKPYIVTAEQIGDPTKMAKLRVKEIQNGTYQDNNVILIGGETTPKLPENPGKGGRNQHYAAVTMEALKNHPGDWAMCSVGTDGADFIKDAAGAIVDNLSLETAKKKRIDIQSYLDRYDSYHLLKKIGNSLIRTGPTGTNVCDIAVYILKRNYC